MYADLLNYSRRIKEIIQNCDAKSTNLMDELVCDMQQRLNSDVLLTGRDGVVLSYTANSDSVFELKEANKTFRIDNQLIAQLLNVYEARENVSLNGFHIKSDVDSAGYFSMIFPIKCGGARTATLIAFRESKAYTDKEILYADFFVSLVSLIVHYCLKEERDSENSRIESVKAAMSTLSYSELEAVVYILRELGSAEGRLIASHVAEKVGVTRSVIVNALRKLESAGVLESRSLGMKGTYIKVTNSMLIDEIEAYGS